MFDVSLFTDEQLAALAQKLDRSRHNDPQYMAEIFCSLVQYAVIAEVARRKK